MTDEVRLVTAAPINGLLVSHKCLCPAAEVDDPGSEKDVQEDLKVGALMTFFITFTAAMSADFISPY